MAELHDLLAQADWTCGSTPPGLVEEPQMLEAAPIEWLAASVPGTSAGALRSAGRWSWGTEDVALLDGSDWWFRCRFEGPSRPGPWQLDLDGLATIADVWLNGRHLLHSENMFLAHRIAVEELQASNELLLRFAALEDVLARRHGRPRWKSRLVRSQSIRWYRTSLLGRMPGWSRWGAAVGPWRPLRLRSASDGPLVIAQRLQAACDDDGGGSVRARIDLRIAADGPAQEVILHVGDVSAPLELTPVGGPDQFRAEGVVVLPVVERWWPHTHGPQPLYRAVLEIGARRLDLGQVGFRTIVADRAHDGFELRINGVPVFCRGACWGSPDAVSFNADPASLRDSLTRARDAGMNMLRVGGYTCYEGPAFWDHCDELGIMVWQDCMIASVDPPEEPSFVATLGEELRQVFGELAARPSLAVACGSSETYQQASMYGFAPQAWESPLLERTIPELLDEVCPGIPYVASSPSGGEPPFTTDVGVTHYFGVGAYLRAVSDARLAGVRFAAECLSFGTPPEPETVAEAFGSAIVAGHHPRWKLTVARDAGTSWDFEDIRDHYVREMFGVDPMRVRYEDPERALDLGRAAVCELMSTVLCDWRRERSPCRGALVLTWQDLWPGAGWGVNDSFGRPKAPLYSLRRAFAPTAVLITDEGLAGLEVHVIHDRAQPFHGLLRLRVFNDAGNEVDVAEREIEVDPRGSIAVHADAMLGGFRDLNHVYRFAPRSADVVVAELRDGEGAVVGEAVYVVGGPARPRLTDLGLSVRAAPLADGRHELSVSGRLFAQYVAIDTPGHEPSDSWFHLPPGATRTVLLRPASGDPPLSGTVRALNGHAVRITVERE